MFQKYRVVRYDNKYAIGKRFFLFWVRGLKCKVYQEVDEFCDGIYCGGWAKYTGKEYLTFKHLADAQLELKKLQFGRPTIKKITCRDNWVTFIDR